MRTKQRAQGKGFHGRGRRGGRIKTGENGKEPTVDEEKTRVTKVTP
jgi:hypothetical protein